MTLQCSQCGGSVEIQGATYGDEYATEQYECVFCGDTGSLSMGPNGDSMSGCLEENGEY